jgi:hypothetical protein
MTQNDAAEVARRLTKAQRHAVVNGDFGYCDDDSLRGSERAMLYRLIDAEVFARPFGVMRGGRRPDIALTPLGKSVRALLLKDKSNV